MPGMTPGGQVQTVLGAVRREELGLVSMHEHLVIDFSVVFREPSEATQIGKALQPVSIENLGWVRYDPFRNLDNLQLFDEDTAISESLRYKIAGGGTIVDVTTIGIARDPSALARIARATGLNIVMGSGYYVGASHPEGMDGKTEQDISREIIADIVRGVGDTGIKAGIIGELGCTWPLTENERKVLRAGAQAQRETGAAITVHPGRNVAAPFEVLDILAESGADVGRVVIGHMGRTYADERDVLELAQRGCFIEYDQFGWEVSNFPLGETDFPSDAQRIGFIKRLVDEGHAAQVVVGQDICAKHCLVKYGGYGYAHLLENIVPRMREKGISDEDLNIILVDNPARILTLR